MQGYVGKCILRRRNGRHKGPGVEQKGLVMCSKLIPEYLLGLDYIFRLLLGSGSHPEMILSLAHLAISEGVLLNTDNP